MHGYPSQINILANLIGDYGLEKCTPNIKYITVGGENLLDTQKNNIENVFNVKVKQHYGLAEGVSNISELPNGKLICDQDFCFTEFVPIDKKPALYVKL